MGEQNMLLLLIIAIAILAVIGYGWRRNGR